MFRFEIHKQKKFVLFEQQKRYRIKHNKVPKLIKKTDSVLKGIKFCGDFRRISIS